MTGEHTVGFVDKIDSDRITVSGWVRCGADGAIPNVSALIGGETLGVATIGKERLDVVQNTGQSNRAFTVQLTSPITAVQVLGGGFQVVAELLATQALLRLSSAVKASEAKSALIELSRQVFDPKTVITDLDRDVDADEIHRVDANRAGAAGQLSPLLFPIGLRSRDKSTQLGREGHLFLTGGSNALHTQYALPETPDGFRLLENQTSKWAELIRARHREVSDLGPIFLQTVIPEKLTTMRRLAPLNISGPTPLLERIEHELHADPFWVSGLEIFENWDSPVDPWQRNDSHCSPAGSLAIARALIEKLPNCDRGILQDVPLDRKTYRDGDLSERFFGTPIWDEHLEPASSFLAEADSAVENTISVNPDRGVVGTHMAWRNRKAPIQKCVVVFGNSYFGSSASEPAKLGWWFARMFAEYHLVWSPAVHIDYVSHVEPDFVIAQTIERFLGKIPSS